MYSFITFNVNDHTVGVDMLDVDRIVKLDKIDSLPNASDYFEGIIEIENLLIPAINLKKIFNFSSIDILTDSNVIVLSYGNRKYAIIVDCVNDIIEISEDNILKTQSSKYIYGAVKVDDVIIKLLNLKTLIID